jgi:hypothetical protein
VPKPLDPQKRAAILDDIKAGGTCRGIARKHEVSDASVRKIAKDAGITDAFSRAQTENATRARTADMKAQRAQLAADLLADAQRLRERAWSPSQVVVGTKDGADIVTLDLPPLRDTREAYTAIGIAIDKHGKLGEMDADHGVGEAKAMLTDLMGALGQAWREQQ